MGLGQHEGSQVKISAGNGKLCFRRLDNLKEDALRGASFMQLTGGMKKARPETEGKRSVSRTLERFPGRLPAFDVSLVAKDTHSAKGAWSQQ